MNHIKFIEKNVREELLRQDFTQAVAQGGGHTRRSICTSGCHRQAAKGKFLTMLCDTQSYGQRSRPAQLNAGKQSAKCERAATRLGCSERVKTVVRQHSQSSGELIGSIHGMKYVKYR